MYITISMPKVIVIGLAVHISVSVLHKICGTLTSLLSWLRYRFIFYSWSRHVRSGGWLGINRLLIVLRFVAIEGIFVEWIIATAVAAPSLRPDHLSRSNHSHQMLLLARICKSTVRSRESGPCILWSHQACKFEHNIELQITMGAEI